MEDENNQMIYDSDDEGEVDGSPFEVSWLDLSFAQCGQKLGISGLPGCRFKNTWRDLPTDLKSLREMGVQEVFCLCTKGELNKYRVPHLLHEMAGADLQVHHYSFPDGLVPPMSPLLKMLDEIRLNLMRSRATLVQCYGGLGRSCLVAACLMMVLDDDMTPEDAIQALRDLRGPGAIQSVKQFNFLHDFRECLAQHVKDDESNRRSLSR